ncbi:MAG: hypothetical protein ACP5E3_17720, partial [Bacteroidales bacterium]
MKNTKILYLHYLILFFIMVFLFSCQRPGPETTSITTGSWRINKDGSYDLTFEDLSLKNCYPAINDQNIMPLSIEIELHSTGGRITYELVEGKLLIDLERDSSGLKISSELVGFNKAPDWVMPLGGGRVSGADRFYKQGFGFAGASGVYQIPQPEDKIERAVLKENVWSYDSYLFTGLISSNENTLVISAYDHQNYQHRSTIYNKQHRIGLIDRHKDTNEIILESGFALEEIAIGPKGLKLPDIYIQTGKKPYATFHEQAQRIA